MISGQAGLDLVFNGRHSSRDHSEDDAYLTWLILTITPFYLAMDIGGLVNCQQPRCCSSGFACLNFGYLCELGGVIGIRTFTIMYMVDAIGCIFVLTLFHRNDVQLIAGWKPSCDKEC